MGRLSARFVDWRSQGPVRSRHRGCAEWYIRRGCSMASQKTTRTMCGACEAVCDGLMDGYRASGAVVGRSVRRVWLPIRIRTIGGVSLSIAISLHLDNFFVSAMSLLVHSQGVDSAFGSTVSWSSRASGATEGREPWYRFEVPGTQSN